MYITEQEQTHRYRKLVVTSGEGKGGRDKLGVGD